MAKAEIVATELIAGTILTIRGQRVMLDADLAALYGVETKRLVEVVKRNLSRFPEDFMFQLTADEAESLRSQIATSKGRGGRRYAPYAFTELGVAMLSSVLNSDRAVEVNIQIMRAFVRLREMLASNSDLTRRLDALERKYDSQFKAVFDAIRQLMTPPVDSPKSRIGYQTEEQRRDARARVKSAKPTALPLADADGNYPALAASTVILARTIIKRREALDMSQKELATAAGIRAETLNRLEKAKVTPDTATLTKIDRALTRAEQQGN